MSNPSLANEQDRYHVGTTIAGRYQVERPIGEGAMGAVALARHLLLDEKVAIKFLRPELRRDPVAIARLSREARALSRIKSDHVARVLDVGVTLAVGPYLVMEYLEGSDLGEVLEVEGPLPVERVVEIVLQVCEALTVAHTAGIVHRDLKPQNLFLARHGQFETVKVLDFGISEDDPRSLPAGQRTASSSLEEGALAQVYGTPSYMAPERVRNDSSVDHRSDIWSIGVVLHELVTGRAVFDAPTTTETCARVLSDAPLELEHDHAVLPPTLRSVIARCLERDPSRRYQSVEELAAALAPLGTMTERFRGRSTGAFSRSYVAEQLALSGAQRLQLPTPGATPPTVGELSTALRDIGAALRWALRAVPLARVHDRPLWQYGAVACGSALAVALVASLGHDFHWVPPPSPSARGELLAAGEKHAVRGVDEPTPATSERGAAVGVERADGAASDGASAEGEDRAPALEAARGERTRAELAQHELERAELERAELERAELERAALARARGPQAALATAVALPQAVEEREGVSSASGARARAKARRAERRASRRQRAAQALPLAPKEGLDELASPSELRLVPERPARARLVKEGAVPRQRLKRQRSAPDERRPRRAARAKPAAPEAPLPEWLELMRNDVGTR